MDIDDWDDDASDRRSYARVIKNIVKSKTAPAQAVKAKRVPANTVSYTHLTLPTIYSV